MVAVHGWPHRPANSEPEVVMDIPIACSLERDDLAQRQRRWAELAGRAIIDVARTGDGLRLRFRGEAGVEAELRELAALERDCCGFAEWMVAGDGDTWVMDISGAGQEAVAQVHEMFANLA
jgi:hypothetical protein